MLKRANIHVEEDLRETTRNVVITPVNFSTLNLRLNRFNFVIAFFLSPSGDCVVRERERTEMN